MGRDSGRCLSFWLSCRSGFPVSGLSGFPVVLAFRFPVVPAFRFSVVLAFRFPVVPSFRLPVVPAFRFPVVLAFRLFQLSSRFYGYCTKIKLKKEKRAVHYNAHRSAYLLRNRLFILLFSSGKEIDFSYKNDMFKWQLNQDRCGLIFLPNICHLPDPLYTARYKLLLST